MHVFIGAIGTLKHGPELDLINDYCRRFAAQGRQIGLPKLHVRAMEVTNNTAATKRKSAEALLLMKQVPDDAALFVLDEHGKAISSKAFAATLGRLKDDSLREAWFLIGGADGHGPAVREALARGRAKSLSLGPATWPHMLARVMICEQLYRAVTILTNHPYHRA